MNENQEQLLLKAEQSLEASKYLYQGGYYDFAVARAYYTLIISSFPTYAIIIKNI